MTGSPPKSDRDLSEEADEALEAVLNAVRTRQDRSFETRQDRSFEEGRSIAKGCRCPRVLFARRGRPPK